ncbi:MAG TPA: hypothetical protein ENG83_12000 [Nitrospirae bacterium]|nr:hypothetical protein BMS3Abin06_02840 [bacterium BMS3Abin06]HDH12897.1 hypothetical protein [Nitrospirota bacterium]HDZ01691.1 hypothetical protein [Nitrospirota bacterium]
MSAPKKVCFITDFFPGIHKKWFGAEIACKRLFELIDDNGRSGSVILTGRADYKEEMSPHIKEVSVLENYQNQIGVFLKTAFPFDPIAYRYFSRVF